MKGAEPIQSLRHESVPPFVEEVEQCMQKRGGR